MYPLLFIIVQVLSLSLSLDPGENNTVDVEEELFMKQFEKAIIFPIKIMRESSNDIKTDGFKEYIDRLKMKGVELIRDSARQVMLELNRDENITKEVGPIMIKYGKKIENYANTNYISDMKSPPLAESLYIFLDVLNTAYLYLYKEQTKVFKDMFKKTNSTNNITTYNGLSAVKLHSIVIKQCFSFKRKELLHICNNYHVCRPYSGFTADLMEVLYHIFSLTNSQFKSFITIFNGIIDNDEDFLGIMAGNENIIKYIDGLFSNPEYIKESLEALRSLLGHRYKIIRISDVKRQRKIQATRVLLDIIDRTLSLDHNEDIYFDIVNTSKAIKHWAKGLVMTDGEEHIVHVSDFITSIFSTLISSESELIPYLINTVLTGKIAHVDGYNYRDLFQDGSKNVYTENNQDE